MTDRDFSIGTRNFKLGKLDAFKQFHIVRRIGPLLSELLPAMKDMGNLKNFDGKTEDDKMNEMAKIVSPIMMGLSKLSDQDSEFVLFGLLASVEVQQAAGNWARVATPTMVMIQDLELPQLLQIAGRAFMYNLSGFFGALPRQG
jgi:hypothetical protein